MLAKISPRVREGSIFFSPFLLANPFNMATILQQIPMRKILVMFIILCVYVVFSLEFTSVRIWIKDTGLVIESQNNTKTTRIFEDGEKAKIQNREDPEVNDPGIEQDSKDRFSNDVRHQINVNLPHAIMDFDIHVEDTIHGHIGLDPHSHISTYEENRNTVAIGLAITSNRVKISYENITIASVMAEFPFYRHLFPSFCRTAEEKHFYHFYFAYDTNDKFFANAAHLDIFVETFMRARQSMGYVHKNIKTWVHFVQCSHSKKPAWAQNDAQMEAYLDNIHYFYRINDDTIMISENWTSTFIQLLDEYDPPRVGVVGPMHKGGNTKILTYDFVHSTHLDMFGIYYPRTFPGM